MRKEIDGSLFMVSDRKRAKLETNKLFEMRKIKQLIHPQRKLSLAN